MTNHSKYCLSIAGPDFESCIKQIQLADFVEFRFDLYNITIEQRAELMQTAKSYIATCRLPDQQQSFKILKSAIEAGATYVDVDISRPENFISDIKELTQMQSCKLIISYHNYENTPKKEQLKDIYQKAKELGADFVKIATMVNFSSDNSAILGLYSFFNNLIAFGMGEIGKITRIACLFCGAPYTYVSSSTNLTTASGQFEITHAKSIIKAINAN